MSINNLVNETICFVRLVCRHEDVGSHSQLLFKCGIILWGNFIGLGSSNFPHEMSWYFFADVFPVRSRWLFMFDDHDCSTAEGHRLGSNKSESNSIWLTRVLILRCGRYTKLIRGTVSIFLKYSRWMTVGFFEIYLIKRRLTIISI